MPLSLPLAVTLCAALMAVDLTVRALRIHLFVRGAGHQARFWDVFVLNAFGDAASAATPMRIGGEPARLAGLAHAGIPIAAAIPILAVEVVSYLVVVVGAALVTGLLLAPEWWSTVAPVLGARARQAGPWVAGVAALSLAAVIAARRMRRGRPRAPRARVMPPVGVLGWPLLASVPLTLLSVASRVAILPVLAQIVPGTGSLGVLVVSSFGLIYGQLFVPTPGGVGAVELAFASGAAGGVGEGLGPVFILWRAFVTGVPLVLGFGLAIPHYGARAVRRALRGRAQEPLTAPETAHVAPVAAAGTEPVA